MVGSSPESIVLAILDTFMLSRRGPMPEMPEIGNAHGSRRILNLSGVTDAVDRASASDRSPDVVPTAHANQFREQEAT